MKLSINKEMLKNSIEDSYTLLKKFGYKITFDGRFYTIIDRKRDEIIAVIEDRNQLDFYVLGFVSGLNFGLEESFSNQTDQITQTNQEKGE